MNPQRIIAFPYNVYLAPQGTEFPTLTDTEAIIQGGKKYPKVALGAGGTTAAESWFLLGTSGNRDYSEAGVTVTHTQTLGTFQGAGSTWIRKAWRSDEGTQVAFDLADLSPTHYAKIMDERTLNPSELATSASANEEWFSLARLLNVNGQSLLLRGPSAINEAKQSQYEIPYAYQAANPAPKYAIKGGPALLALQFTAIEGEASTTSEPLKGLPRLRVGVK
jgi:hypothetical protein